MPRVARSVEGYDRFSQLVDGPMTILAIAWLPVLVAPAIFKMGPAIVGALDTIDYTLWAIFAVEYLIKLGLAPSRGHYIRTHLLDLFVIALPFLRPLRALRFLRLLRAGTVAGEGLKRAKRLLTEHGLQYVLLAAVVMVFAGATAVFAFEQHASGSNIHSFGDALWWAIVTVTTVGYGDHYPVTADGRAIAVVLMLVGIGLIGVITANVAAFFVAKNDTAEQLRHEELESRLERIEQLLTTLALDATESGSSERFAAAIRDNGPSDGDRTGWTNGLSGDE